MNFRGFGGASQSQNDGGIIGEISPGKIYFLACFVMPEFSLAHHDGFLSIITDKALNISVIGKRIVLVYICIKNTYQRLSQKVFFGGGDGSGLLKSRWKGRASDRDLAGERTIFTLSHMASGFLISSKQKQLDSKHVGGNNCRDSFRYSETGLRLSSRI